MSSTRSRSGCCLLYMIAGVVGARGHGVQNRRGHHHGTSGDVSGGEHVVVFLDGAGSDHRSRVRGVVDRYAEQTARHGAGAVPVRQVHIEGQR